MGKLNRKCVPIFIGDEPAVPDRRLLEVKELLRPDEAADILRISRSEVYGLCAKGRLESIKIGSSVRIRSISVKGMLENGTI